MAKFHDQIEDHHREFIESQHLFFVSTAPLSAEGHINLSPKGLDSFRVLSPTKVAYMDIIGSGNETSAHILENGRITFMFCAFGGPPNILRLYGNGYTVLPDDPEWAELSSHLQYCLPPDKSLSLIFSRYRPHVVLAFLTMNIPVNGITRINGRKRKVQRDWKSIKKKKIGLAWMDYQQHWLVNKLTSQYYFTRSIIIFCNPFHIAPARCPVGC